SSCFYLLVTSSLFFFNDTATTEIYTLSLHDALPISVDPRRLFGISARARVRIEISLLPRLLKPAINCGRGVRPALAMLATGLVRSEEHTSELQSPCNLVCRLLLEKKKKKTKIKINKI